MAVGERFDGLERKVDDGVEGSGRHSGSHACRSSRCQDCTRSFCSTVASLEDSVRGLDRRVVRLEEKKSERIGLAIEMQRDGMRRCVHGEYKESPCLGALFFC